MASSSTPEKTPKNSASERFVFDSDKDVERFVEAEANNNTQRNAQRRSIDEVVFAKRKRNKITRRHTAARIRRLPQRISTVCEKSLVMNMSQQRLRGIIASVERYLRNLRYSESVIEGTRLTVELFERHLFKRISQF